MDKRTYAPSRFSEWVSSSLTTDMLVLYYFLLACAWAEGNGDPSKEFTISEANIKFSLLGYQFGFIDELFDDLAYFGLIELAHHDRREASYRIRVLPPDDHNDPDRAEEG